MLFELYSIDNQSLMNLLDKTLLKSNISCENDAKKYLVASSGGDARAMLNLLNFAIEIDDHVNLKILKSHYKNIKIDYR